MMTSVCELFIILGTHHFTCRYWSARPFGSVTIPCCTFPRGSIARC